METGEVAVLVNSNKAFDTDWGTLKWDTTRSFRIVVTPEDLRESRWSFFILLPECSDQEVGILCNEMIDAALSGRDAKDGISIIPICDSDMKDAEVLPILAFHPMDSEVCIWLRPPLSMRN